MPKSNHADQSAQSQSCAYHAAIVTESCRVARRWINSDLSSSLLFTYRTVSYFLRNLIWTIGCDQGQRSGVFSLKTLLWSSFWPSNISSVCNCKISVKSVKSDDDICRNHNFLCGYDMDSLTVCAIIFISCPIFVRLCWRAMQWLCQSRGWPIDFSLDPGPIIVYPCLVEAYAWICKMCKISKYLNMQNMCIMVNVKNVKNLQEMQDMQNIQNMQSQTFQTNRPIKPNLPNQA